MTKSKKKPIDLSFVAVVPGSEEAFVYIPASRARLLLWKIAQAEQHLGCALTALADIHDTLTAAITYAEKRFAKLKRHTAEQYAAPPSVTWTSSDLPDGTWVKPDTARRPRRKARRKP